MTISEKFIKEKLDEFVPNNRTGSKRGQLLGIQTKSKYTVALCLALFHHKNYKALAEQLGTTPQQIALFKQRDCVLRTIEDLQVEFANLVISRLQRHIIDHPDNIFINEEFADICNYNPNVVKLVQSDVLELNYQKLSILCVLLFGSERSKQMLEKGMLLQRLLILKEHVSSKKPLFALRDELSSCLNDAFQMLATGGVN
jgi:hypothetical protein